MPFWFFLWHIIFRFSWFLLLLWFSAFSYFLEIFKSIKIFDFYLLGFFGFFFSKLFRLLQKVTEVTTEHQNKPKIGKKKSTKLKNKCLLREQKKKPWPMPSVGAKCKPAQLSSMSLIPSVNSFPSYNITLSCSWASGVTPLFLVSLNRHVEC